MNALSLFRAEPEDNACRFSGSGGHVESYFLRLNDPSKPRALWLKQTILSPLKGSPVAETWLIWFDGAKEPIATRVTEPWTQFKAPDIDTAALKLNVGATGRALTPTPLAGVSVDLSWKPSDSPIAKPLSIFPYRFLRVGPFPKSKLLTPSPALIFGGTISLSNAERVDVAGWHGMQGHNWGKEHSFEYAWGQCLFPSEDAMLEGFTGRVRVGGRTTPRMSALIVRRGGREFRFDRIFDPWRQEQLIEPDRWEIRLRSDDGEAHLVMNSSARAQACLGYRNPDDVMSYCFNSKLASVECEVRPSDGAAFTLKSEHGGALEFLRREPDPRFPKVT
ncbi:MAG: hypothetical protein JNM17_08565 [Archangium sp.]|nr:hypothetical protein [Archangium sp.]